MEFRLSEYTKTLLQNSRKYKSKTPKKEAYFNSKKFYDTHPELMPGDPLIYEGRLLTKEEMDKTIRKFERRVTFENFIEDAKQFAKNISERVKKILGLSQNK